MAEFSYSKNFRLISASDFSNLKVDSKIFKKPNLRVYYVKNKLSNSRLGISVSKKIGNSILRSRYKRISRELFRQSSVRNLNYDFLFVVQNYNRENLNKEELEIFLKNSIFDFFNYLSRVN